MEDNKTVDTQTTTQDTSTQNEVKTFTQEELDQAVSNRIARTKETFAKKLGLESYSDEALESFVSEYKDLSGKVTELNETIATKENILFEKDLRVEALSLGVKTENLDKVAKLVKTDLQENTELDVKGALTQVLEDYPFFGNVVDQKTLQVGIETKTDKSAPNEVDAYLKAKYKNSRYYNEK